MAEELPSLHIDTDWKKQAQEEKKRLAEEEAKRAAAAPPPTPALAPGAAPATAAAAGCAGGGQRTTPPPGFASLVQTILTQGLYFLGDFAHQGQEPVLNLDMAKYQIDTLNSLEEKTVNNLTPDEQHLLDAALYEVRMCFINVASQFL